MSLSSINFLSNKYSLIPNKNSIIVKYSKVLTLLKKCKNFVFFANKACYNFNMENKNKNADGIMLTCNINGDAFVRFAKYDTFKRKKAWKSPVIFASIMSAFALVCFTILKDRAQSALLGTVLLAVGLVVPAVYYFMYMSSVRKQVKKYGLRSSKAQYFVRLDSDRIHVVKGKETLDHAWEDVYMFVEDKGVSYLYVSETRAYLLVHGDNYEEARKIIESKITKEKIKKA